MSPRSSSGERVRRRGGERIGGLGYGSRRRTGRPLHRAFCRHLRQIRLRDIGGIILVDFIDMEKAEQKEHLLQVMREKVRLDRTKTNIVDITSLGLVEITRKKSRQNLDSIIYSECPVCHGRGRIESPETVSIRISKDIRRMERTSHAREGYEIEVHESVAEELRANQLMMNLAAEFGADIKVTIKPGLHPESYSILQQS